MRVFAYGLESGRRVLERVAGCEAVTCPPVHANEFRRGWLEYRDLIILRLHGLRGERMFLGDKGEIALTAWQLQGVKMHGAVVFAACCHLPESPMLEKLLGAGPRAVVGGSGPNYGSAGHRLTGADLLGLYFRWALQVGLSVDQALGAAKLRLAMRPSKANKDTLGFKVYRG